jgi:hypothetical protein
MIPPRTAFRTLFLLACGLSAALLTACLPISTPAPEPVASETPTATAIWFPATNTPSPVSTQPSLPTYETRPGLGEVILQDDFTQPEAWQATSTNNTSATVDHGELTLGISDGIRPVTLFSPRLEPVLRDFYAEITVRTSLCRGADQYGLLVRMMSYNDYYRYALNCQGEVRLERVQGGQAYPLQNWVPSGDAPPGAPAEVLLGVWASGTEMRFFLNGRLQFTVRDPVFGAGGLGVFIVSTGTTPVTVSFRDLVVSQVSYRTPTPSQTPTRTLTPTRTPTP